MKLTYKPTFASLVLILAVSHADAQLPENLKWRKVVNNSDPVPGATSANFNSYNQPSINAAGLVVFRARSKGPNPISGIYTRNMLVTETKTKRIADRSSIVPWPNNTAYEPDGLLSAFNVFPSIPRISMWTKTIATRGNSKPVWTYQVDGADTKVGTSGIYLNPDGELITGVGLLGAVPSPEIPLLGLNYFPYMDVPGAVPGTRFDVFPGSPALGDGDVIAFKGNYTENNIGKTGVYFRNTVGGEGKLPVRLIANTSTVIPNLPGGVSNITFGSTAPPSAAGNSMVFAGYDNEESPTYGGIYLAELKPSAPLKTLVGLGMPVPGEIDSNFTQFGEALSFDGRYVAFWGAWGTEKQTLWLDCPTDGNADLLAYCAEHYGDNYPVQVSANQGIFVYDIKTDAVYRVARNGGEIADFVYWNFSGKPPGIEGGDEGDDGEPPRWRSTSFVAVSGGPGNTFIVAFKARKGVLDPGEHNYLTPIDGIYLADNSNISTLVDTTMDGQRIDPAAPAGSKVSSVGIEREAFRGRWLAMTAGMTEPVSSESLAGIYVTRVFTRTVKAPKGTYTGVLEPHSSDSNPVCRIVMEGKGVFSGNISIGSRKFPVSGKLNDTGGASVKFRLNGNNGPLVLKLVSATVSGIPILEMKVTGYGRDHVGTAACLPK